MFSVQVGPVHPSSQRHVNSAPSPSIHSPPLPHLCKIPSIPSPPLPHLCKIPSIHSPPLPHLCKIPSIHSPPLPHLCKIVVHPIFGKRNYLKLNLTLTALFAYRSKSMKYLEKSKTKPFLDQIPLNHWN